MEWNGLFLWQKYRECKFKTQTKNHRTSVSFDHRLVSTTDGETEALPICCDHAPLLLLWKPHCWWLCRQPTVTAGNAGGVPRWITPARCQGDAFDHGRAAHRIIFFGIWPDIFHLHAIERAKPQLRHEAIGSCDDVMKPRVWHHGFWCQSGTIVNPHVVGLL